MNIVITGASGFIGQNLAFHLEQKTDLRIQKIVRHTPNEELVQSISQADFIFHLAGANRPQDERDFITDNCVLTKRILEIMKSTQRKIPILFASSIKAMESTPYGASKAAAENLVKAYGSETGSPFYIYRLPNVFGKWCRPNYNSFIATFCYNIAHGLPVDIHSAEKLIDLVYIDDLCKHFCERLKNDDLSGYFEVIPKFSETIGNIAKKINTFHSNRGNLFIENVGNGFNRALYATYLSYLDPNDFSYSVPSYEDHRGTFCEFIKNTDTGQLSFFTAKPGITRGGHYHHTKSEKFLVIAGTASFKFKNILSGEFYEIKTSEADLRVVETVPGWAHDVTNIGNKDLLVMLWANEVFDLNQPDTTAFSNINAE